MKFVNMGREVCLVYLEFKLEKFLKDNLRMFKDFIYLCKLFLIRVIIV